ncbi:replication ATP-dependent helicase, partial [Butyricicoccus sp. 1XD8-22]
NELKIERDIVQEYSEKIYYLRKLKAKQKEQFSEFEKEEKKKRSDLIIQEKEAEAEIESLKQKRITIQRALSSASIELENLTNEQVQAERNFNVVISQKPSFLWFQKIFNKSKVEQYFKDLNSANEHLNYLTQQKSKVLNNSTHFDNELKIIADKIEFIQKQKQDRMTVFNQWMT